MWWQLNYIRVVKYYTHSKTTFSKWHQQIRFLKKSIYKTICVIWLNLWKHVPKEKRHKGNIWHVKMELSSSGDNSRWSWEVLGGGFIFILDFFFFFNKRLQVSGSFEKNKMLFYKMKPTMSKLKAWLQVFSPCWGAFYWCHLKPQSGNPVSQNSKLLLLHLIPRETLFSYLY